LTQHVEIIDLWLQNLHLEYVNNKKHVTLITTKYLL